MGSDEETILQRIRQGDTRALARAISHVENGVGNYGPQLAGMPSSPVKVIGVTGPPGAGKSTLADALIGEWVGRGKTVATLCIDPSSAFHHGALLGDRIRMSDWYNDPRVFIRSLASRGALGGLNPRIIGIIDLLRWSVYDLLLIETVGVGQNEIEIAALADTVLVVLAPEAGDDIQSMKSGLLEIADIFVVNKSDRPDADIFVRNLRMMQSPAFRNERPDGVEAPVLKTVALQKQGVAELAECVLEQLQKEPVAGKRWRVLAEQAYLLLQEKRMKGVDKKELAKKIEALSRAGQFNLYRFVEEWG